MLPISHRELEALRNREDESSDSSKTQQQNREDDRQQSTSHEPQHHVGAEVEFAKVYNDEALIFT